MESGYIKLYRSMLEWEWYDDINVKVVFLHLLLKANYTDREWHGELIKRGQILTSIKNLSNELNLGEKQVRNVLEKLKKTKEISVKGTNKFTLITIEKYMFFQDYSEEKDEQGTIKRQSKDNQETNKRQSTDEQGTIKGQQHKKEIKKESKEGEEREKVNYQLIADMYNATCVSFPKCVKLSQARKDAIKARLKAYEVEDFKQLFEIAEMSDFLKGRNNRNWTANFDWLIADRNMTKALEGYYNNRTPQEVGGDSFGRTNINERGIGQERFSGKSNENNGVSEGTRLERIAEQYSVNPEDLECDF